MNKMKIINLSPKVIKVPDVRITSTWDAEEYEMFQTSIKEMGMASPIVVIKEDEDYILVDGLHRLDEAKKNNMEKIPCAVLEGSMKDVHLRNLILNKLRGGTKASEMIKVIKELNKTHNLNIEEIASRTGLKKGYIEQMLQISSVIPEVWEALDKEEIKVGHAFHISRIKDEATQNRLLNLVMQYSVKVKEMDNIVTETLNQLNVKEQVVTSAPTYKAPPPETAFCHLCEEQAKISNVRGYNICIKCYGMIQLDFPRRLKEYRESLQRGMEIAEKATENVKIDENN